MLPVLVNSVVVYTPVEVPPPPEAIMSFDGTGPRLMITHIVNENFKSYAGVQTLGPFHKVSFAWFLMFNQYSWLLALSILVWPVI